MWAPWLRSPSSSQPPSSPSNGRLRHFRCSSFKDIQTLCQEEQPPYSPPLSPRNPSIFHRLRLSASLLRSRSHRHSPTPTLPDSDHRIVVYHTSLRIVRKTFEDCRAVRSILRGFRVSIDERDLSMDSSFLGELRAVTGCKSMTLPRVFIGGRYIGGAEEIKRLNETGELKRLIQGLPEVHSNFCDVCGGHRFVLCDVCDGSRKIYLEKSGFKSCSSCNVYGLIRCPSCCSLTPRSARAWL